MKKQQSEIKDLCVKLMLTCMGKKRVNFGYRGHVNSVDVVFLNDESSVESIEYIYLEPFNVQDKTAEEIESDYLEITKRLTKLSKKIVELDETD